VFRMPIFPRHECPSFFSADIPALFFCNVFWIDFQYPVPRSVWPDLHLPPLNHGFVSVVRSLSSVPSEALFTQAVPSFRRPAISGVAGLPSSAPLL